MKSPPEREAAPAKINLFLHVGERRADGYHALQSLAVFADEGDVLDFAPGEGVALAIEGPFARGLAAEDDNLVLKAARALAQRMGEEKSAAIRLTKNLPVASGIGGGSSDAAAALRGLMRLWKPGLGPGALAEVAAGLGSDVPVCLAAAPAWMEGRGEIVSPLAAIPDLAMLLVNPGVAVPTREVFAGLARRSGAALACSTRFEDTADLLRFLEGTANDLEAPARAIRPVIGEVLAALARLPGALFARMSGSGATCFAIFPDEGACARAGETLRAAHSDWWIAPTKAKGTGLAERVSRAADIGPTAEGL